MSLVGTRPILQDELEQYELHHRATQSESLMYKNIFGMDEQRFSFAKCGAIQYEAEQFDDNELKKRNYLFSTGRSNRDYEFLIRTIEKTEYQLVLACDMLNEESHNNIEVRKNTFGKEMLRYMRNGVVFYHGAIPWLPVLTDTPMSYVNYFIIPKS